MKAAGCIMIIIALAIVGVTVGLGVGGFKKLAEKPEVIARADLEAGKAASITGTELGGEKDKAVVYLARLRAVVSSPESTSVQFGPHGEAKEVRRPKFELPYQVVIEDVQKKEELDRKEGKLYPHTFDPELFFWSEHEEDTEERMAVTVYFTIPLPEEPQPVKVAVRGKLEADVGGKAKVESAQLAIVRKAIPLGTLGGMALGGLASVCVAPVLGIVGLVLLLVGFFAKKEEPRRYA